MTGFTPVVGVIGVVGVIELTTGVVGAGVACATGAAAGAYRVDSGISKNEKWLCIM